MLGRVLSPGPAKSTRSSGPEVASENTAIHLHTVNQAVRLVLAIAAKIFLVEKISLGL